MSLFNSFKTEAALSYRNQSIDLLCKSMDWFLYDNALRPVRVNNFRAMIGKLFGSLRLPRFNEKMILKSYELSTGVIKNDSILSGGR